MNDKHDNFVEVYSALHEMQAHVLKSALEDEGIEVRIGTPGLQCAAGLPAGIPTAPRLLVRASQAERALDIIRISDPSAGREAD